MPIVTGITSSETAAAVARIWIMPQKGWHDFRLPTQIVTTTVGKGNMDPIPLPADIAEHIISFSYTAREMDGMDTFEIVMSNRNLWFLDTPWMQKGNVIDMQWGYLPSNFTPRKKGIISGIKVVSGTQQVIVITGNCPGSLLAGKCRTGVWGRVNWHELKRIAGKYALESALGPIPSVYNPELGYTPSEIAIELAELYGLKAEVQDTGPTRVWWQSGISDWDFLKLLASVAVWKRKKSDIGFRFWVDYDTLHFHAVQADPDKEIVMEYAHYGDDTAMLKEFEINDEAQAKMGEGVETTAVGFDTRRMDMMGFMACDQTVVERLVMGKETAFKPGAMGTLKNQTSSKFLEVDPSTLKDTHTMIDEESNYTTKRSLLTNASAVTAECPTYNRYGERNPSKRVASSKFVEAELDQVEMTIVSRGWPTLWARKLVNMRCIGSQYGGLYYILEARHEPIGPKEYQVRMKTRRNAVGDSDNQYSAYTNPAADSINKVGEKIEIEKVPFKEVPVEYAGSVTS